MALFNRYSLGHGDMDRTHRESVPCAAALQTAKGADPAGCLAAFEAHAVEHFEQERRRMDFTGFPAAQFHLYAHETVLSSGGPGQVARDLAREHASWFSGHVDDMDASPTQSLLKRGLGEASVVLHHRLEPSDAPLPPSLR